MATSHEASFADVLLMNRNGGGSVAGVATFPASVRGDAALAASVSLFFVGEGDMLKLCGRVLGEENYTTVRL